MPKLPTKPELPAWAFVLLRVGSFALVVVAAWFVARCSS